MKLRQFERIDYDGRTIDGILILLAPFALINRDFGGECAQVAANVPLGRKRIVAERGGGGEGERTEEVERGSSISKGSWQSR